MLKIWGNLEKVKQTHIDYCRQFVNVRLQQYQEGKLLRGLASAQKQTINSLLAIAMQNIENILGGSITELKLIDETLKRVDANYSNYSDQLLKIIDYDFFSYYGLPFKKKPKLWDSYELIKGIGLKTCPYCNEGAIYTIYTESSGKMRADLDHVLPKSKYPIFALSFHNLIPVCHSCNLVKLDKQLDVDPYTEYFDLNDRFVFHQGPSFSPLLSNDTSDSSIKFLTIDERKANQVTALHIEARYNHHKDIVVDIYRNKEIYNKIYNMSLSHLLPELGHLSEKDIFRMLFNVSHQLEEYHEKPYSKLTNDLLRQLNS
jgi:hypothetical protein